MADPGGKHETMLKYDVLGALYNDARFRLHLPDFYWRPLPDSNRCCRRERAKLQFIPRPELSTFIQTYQGHSTHAPGSIICCSADVFGLQTTRNRAHTALSRRNSGSNPGSGPKTAPHCGARGGYRFGLRRLCAPEHIKRSAPWSATSSAMQKAVPARPAISVVVQIRGKRDPA